MHHNRPGRERQTPKSTHMLNASRGESGRVDPRARRGLCTQPQALRHVTSSCEIVARHAPNNICKIVIEAARAGRGKLVISTTLLAVWGGSVIL
jgi:hypothetical protein